MTMSRILILSGPIQSGKTTSLIKNFSKSDSVGGFICPDVLGSRMIYFADYRRLVPFQLVELDNAISIGKFKFDENIFSKAYDLLVNPITLEKEIVVVDEIGPLELKEQGYYQALIMLIDNWRKKENGTLILVIREHLIVDVVAKFDLKDAEIITKDNLLIESKSDIEKNAIILSGGESSRMKTDKFLLKYDGLEQYKRLQNMFDILNINTFLSCNKNQDQIKNLSIDTIVDIQDFEEAGPLTGILSAFEKLQSDLFVIGCDYPHVAIDHLLILKQFADYGFNEIAFMNNDRVDEVEPLICFLSKQSLNNLKLFYAEGGRSLNKFLQQINPLKIQLKNDSFLRSFDTPEDYQSYCNI